jgi:hypothetical protein
MIYDYIQRYEQEKRHESQGEKKERKIEMREEREGKQRRWKQSRTHIRVRRERTEMEQMNGILKGKEEREGREDIDGRKKRRAGKMKRGNE